MSGLAGKMYSFLGRDIVDFFFKGERIIYRCFKFPSL